MRAPLTTLPLCPVHLPQPHIQSQAQVTLASQSLPLAPPFSTPWGAWRLCHSFFFLVPCLSLPQPNPTYPALKLTSRTHPPLHPVPSSSIQGLHNFLPSTSPSLTDLPVKGIQHILNSPASCLNSHHSLQRASPSHHICQLKLFLSFKGQLKCQWVHCSPFCHSLPEPLDTAPLEAGLVSSWKLSSERQGVASGSQFPSGTSVWTQKTQQAYI